MLWKLRLLKFMQKIKKTILWTLVVFMIIYVGVVSKRIYQFYFPMGGFKPVCPQETKICEDGSVVERVGASCDLADCPERQRMTENEAREIAEKIWFKKGENIIAGDYNEKKERWEFEIALKEKRKGCESVCWVSEKDKEAKINWNCENIKK